MKSRKKLLVLFLLISLLGNAQKMRYTISESIKNQTAWAKLIQLKNGNTCLIQVPEVNGFTIILFDKNRKVITDRLVNTFDILNKDLKKTEVVALFELNNKVELFIAEEIKGIPTLVRLSIDSQTGNLLAETKVSEMVKSPGIGSYFAYKSGGLARPRFNVVKDPNSDYYAVGEFTPFAESDGRIKIKHYNPAHFLINELFYTPPESDYKYINYMDIYVHNKEYVLLATYMYNTRFRGKGGLKSKIYLSKLFANNRTFSHVELPNTESFKESIGLFVYNKQTKNIHMPLRTLIEKSSEYSYYSVQVYVFEPNEVLFDSTINIPYVAANLAYQDYFHTKKNYIGMPHYYNIDYKGDNIMLFQETNLYAESGIGGMATTKLGNMVLQCFDKKGQECYSRFIPCNYRVLDFHDRFTYNIGQVCYKPALKTHILDLPNYWYFHVDYISTDIKSFLFMNDHYANLYLKPRKKAKLTSHRSSLISRCYEISDQGVEKQVELYSNTEDDKIKIAHNFQASSLDEKNRVYATLVVESKSNVVHSQRVIWYELPE